MADEFGSDNPYLRFLRPPGAGPSTLAQDAAAESTSTNPYLRLRAMSRAAAPVPDAGAPSSAGGIGSYVSAALAPQDVAFRYGARHLFGIPVSDEATAASALTSGLGLQQGGEGYGKRVLRSGIEFGADVGLNPLTYALPGGGAVARGATAKAALEAGSRLAPEALGALAPEAATAAARLVRQGAIARRVSQAAGVGFTGMMGAGLAQKVPQIAQDIGAHGFTPEVAGELTSAGLEAAGAGLGAAHLYHGLKTPYGIPEPAPTVNVPLEGPVQEGAIPRVTTISSLGEAARVNQFYREQGTPESDPAGTQYSPSWVDEPIPVPGFESPIPRGRGLSPEQRAVEDRATAQVTQDPAGMVAAYRQANTKNGTLIINTDNARELFPDYNENRALHSPAVHEPASWLVRRAWEQALAEPTPEGKQPVVVFTSGASGVGKSTGLKLLKEADDAHIIFDTNMSTLDSSIEKIEQARAAGNFVVVQATHRDPVEAWFDGVVHRAMKPDDGRMVPLDTHMATTSAPEVFKALRDRYANDPDVGFRLADNSRGKNNAKLVDVRAFDGLQYDQEKIRGQIEDETRRRVEAGELPPRILQGAGIQFPGVDGSVQSGVRGQPESERVEGQPGAAAPAAPVPAEGIEPQPPEPVRVLSQHTPEQAREILAMQERADAAAAQAAGGGNAVPESAAAAPHYAVAPKQPAEPPSKLGFYSQLSRVVASLPQPMKGSDMARYLADPKRGVKAEEMKWTGLDDWLKERAGAKVTPQEVQDFVRANAVEVKQVTLSKGEPHKFGTPEEQQDANTRLDAARQAMRDSHPGDQNWNEVTREFRDAETAMQNIVPGWGIAEGGAKNAPKFSQWQLPGGSHYREVLLTLPLPRDAAKPLSASERARWQDLKSRRGVTYEEEKELSALTTREHAYGLGAEKRAFTGGHFDEPNVLAHVRLNDRTDADGKRVLFVEEVQSDWAQKGRREGFRNDPKRITDLQSQYDGITEAMLAAKSDPREQVRLAGDLANIEAALREAKSSGIPQAPFVTNTSDWSVLAMKRIMRMAAEEGYDRVAWTTGEQQAARYDLSKHVERVLARNNSDGSFVISYIKKGGGPDSWDVIPGSFSAEELAAHVGKDLADKIIADAGKVRPGAPLEYSGLDLKVGGEGMNAFYDKILPQVAEKVGKKWGVKVGETKVRVGRESAAFQGEPTYEDVLSMYSPQEIREIGARVRSDDVRAGFGRVADALESGGPEAAARATTRASVRHAILDASVSKRATGKIVERFSEPVHSIDITPEMRASVAGEGFPQFKAAEQGAPAAGLKTRDVQTAFGKAPVREAMGGWQVGLGGEREIFIHPTGEIEYNPAAFKAGYNREMTASERVVGEYRRQGGALGRDGVIWLAKDAPEGTVHHEAFHAAMDLVLSDKEKAAVLSKYGNEEAAAEAYAKWTPAQTNSWFSKILAFFTRVYRSFKPTWESAFEETRSGRAFGREEPVRAPAGVAVPFAPAPPADFNRAKSTSSRPGFLSEYSDHDLAGKQTFLSPDKRTGYLLDENGDFGNLFNTGPKGAGREAILHAIEKGDAQTLDAFDGYLPDLYAQYGFKPTGAMKWNDEYAPKGWNYARDGRPDVVFMSYQGGDRGTIRDRVGTFEPYTHPGNYYDSFDQAKADSRAAGLAGEQGAGARPRLGGQEPAGAGEPVGIHRQPVGSPKAAVELSGNFKKWFGGSKVVDEGGKPLKVYHRGGFDETENGVPVIGPEGMHFGTKDAADARPTGKVVDDTIRGLTVDKDENGRWHWRTEDGLESYDLDENGFDTAKDAREAGERDAVQQGENDFNDPHEGTALTTTFLSIKNPMRVADQAGDWKAAIEKAKKLGHDGLVYRNQYEDKGSTSYVVFDPAQVKSTGNRGTFNPENPDIRYATAPAEPPKAPEPMLTDRLKEAALGTGGRTSAKPGAGGERESPINLDRLNTPDDVKQMMDRLTTAALPDIRRGKGKMTLAEIKAAGEEILGKGQFDERKLERMQRENSALNSAQMTAARMLHQSAIDRVMEAGKAHAEALKDPHADSTRTEDALNATVLKWKGVGLAALGRQAEAARTLAAHNIFVEGLNPEQRMLHDMMKQNGMAMSDAEVKELVLAAASGDRKAVENAARKALAPSWFDKFYEVYVNGLISGPATHIANNASNTGMQAAGVVKRLLSAGIEQVRAKVQGQTPERFVDDTYAHLRGLKRGLASAFEPDSPYSFSTAMKGGASGGKLEINRLGAIPGKLGEVVRLPGTALEAEDKVFKSASFFSEAYVRAGRKARGEAVNRGMADTAAEEYISKRREEIVDAIDKSYRESTKAGKSYSGPFKDIFEPAEKAARYDTFQKEAGPILAAVMRLREADPTGIFKIVMPFMRTPANIAKVTIEHTPLKLFEIAKKIRNGELKGGQISDELAKPLFGALLAIPVVYAAKEGMLTGSGPTDPKERELWRATGVQPNSVVIPIDGKLTYISYGRLEPIATLMTMAVDFNEAADAKTRGTAADKIVGTILNAANDKTFLSGLSDLVLAWHDPKRYASTLVKDTAGNLVPASSLMRATAHAIDPVTRERVGVLDAMMANIPGLSQRLAAKPTGTGVPIERQHPIISSLTPFSTTEERPENRIERLMLDLDFHPSTPQRILTIPGSHGRKVELTREEFAAFEKTDRETTTKLQGLVDRLKHLPSEEQRAYLERAYSNAARGVRERLYGTSSFRERARTALDAAKQERLQSAGAP